MGWLFNQARYNPTLSIRFYHGAILLITFPTMPTSSTLKVEPLTIEDTSDITNLWFAAFTDPQMRRVIPDTRSVRKWLEDANINDITTKPFQRYLKVVDTGSKDDQGRLRIAAYAKWDLSMPDERGQRYPPWHEDMPRQLCEEFFDREEKNRKHFCMFPTHSLGCFYPRKANCFIR
jgi:hypothetical protein